MRSQSGHAVHIGALASAASELSPRLRTARLEHRHSCNAHSAAGAWTSDVVNGVAIGAGVERLLRQVTGYGRHPAAR